MSALKNLLVYTGALIITLIVLYLIKIFDVSYPFTLTITNTTKTSELAVVGEGKVEVVPDIVTVTAGISVNAVDTAEKAQKALDEVNNKIIEKMKGLGIEKKDIKTSNYSITPNYQYTPTGNKVDGYNGNATVAIKVRKIPLASKVITEATAAGANNIQGTSFETENPEKYRELAREKAIENAKQQALKLAKELGISLGRIVNIAESSPRDIYPIYAKAEMATTGDGSGPRIEPGSQTVTSTVTLYFEKK